MAKKFTITKQSAIRLLKESGVVNAPNYTDARLVDRLQRYDELDEDRRNAVKGHMQKLQDSLMLAITRGDLVVLADGGQDEEKVPQPRHTEELAREKPKKKSRVMEAVEERRTERKKKKKVKTGQQEPVECKTVADMPQRGVGIKQFIVELLTFASKKAPITKKSIVSKVIKKFTDRSPETLKRTVRHYVPGYLRRCGVNVRASTDGYWIKQVKD